jgi:hypothetical protein
MKNRQEAARLLKYYFRLLAKKSGLNWDNDNDMEVEQIIECIFDEIEDSINSHNEARVSHMH